MTTEVDKTQGDEYNARSSDDLPKHVVFAARICDLAYREQYDMSTTINGLSIAVASSLVDFVVDADGNVKDEDISEVVEKFMQQTNAAIKFAREQVKSIVQQSH